MKPRKILSLVMALLMAVSMLPSLVFAAEPSSELGGRLKIKGTAAVGSVLSADYTKVTPEGVTDDDVTFSWSRKTSETEDPVEVGTEKQYTLTEEDLGYKIILKVTGNSEKGMTGELKANTVEIVATAGEAPDDPTELTDEEKAAAAAEQSLELTTSVGDETVEAGTDETVVEESTGEPVSEPEILETTQAPETDYQIPETTQEPAAEPQSADDSQNGSIQTDDSVLDIGMQESLNYPSEETTEASYAAEVYTDNEEGTVDFGTAEAGYEEAPEAQYVTITNTGSGTLTFDNIAPEHFMVQDVEASLEPGQSVTLWIQPRIGVEAGTYNDTITYTTAEGASVSFEADFTVTETASSQTTESAAELTTADGNAQADSQNADAEQPTETTTKAAAQTTEAVTESTTEATTQTTTEAETETTTEATRIVDVNVSSLDFGILTTGYTPAAQDVVLSNTGNTDASIAFTGNNSFDILGTDGAVLTEAVVPANGTLTIQVQPKAGLSAGIYSDVITVTGGDQPASVTAAVTVSDPVVYGVSADPAAIDFGSAEAGYTQPAAVTVTVTNTGNAAINLTQPTATNFVVGNLSTAALAAGASATFTVQPNAGLAEGTYGETITVAGDNAQTSLNVSFVVTAAEVKLTGIISPEAITDLANGTEKSADGLSLPSKVVITTTDGKKKASVKWDVKGSAYSVTTTEKQVFTVKGTVVLPDGVTNQDNIGLVTSVKVTVNGRTVKVADPANNTISGISSSGTYTTETKITITATGAGMDNTVPGVGDTRYIPASWKVLESRNWDSAPYTATFRMGKGGSYTLSVVYNQQKYDGSAWQNTGAQDTKQVSFSVADVTVTGANLTPAVTQTPNQKNAVQTGDNTPIMSFVIILVVAVVVIVGVVVYRNKKKK